MKTWLDSLMYETWGGQAVTCEIDGKVRSVATNGKALVLVDGDHAGNRDSVKEGLVKSVLKMDREYSSFSIPLEKIRSWLPDGNARPPCPTCKGGQIKEFKCDECDGSGRDVCGECGNDTECDVCGGAGKSMLCEECEGDGWVDAKRSPAPVRGNVIIDRRLVQQFLGDLEGDVVSVATGGELDAVHIVGPTWTVLCMPMRWTSDQGEMGPALEVA